MKTCYISARTKNSRRWLFALGALAAVTCFASPVLAEAEKPSNAVRLARVDEFDIVPMGHSLYRDMAAVQQAGWSSQKGTLKTALTRYEMAVDTAKAIVAVTAKRAANDSWINDAPRGALRSLRSMTQALRPELTNMGVDVAATLRLLNEALQPKLPSVKPAETVMPSTRPAANTATRTTPEVNVQLSQRLRLSAALSSLARETVDPLGDSALLGLSDVNPAVNAQLALGVGDRLTLRAGVSKRELTPAPLTPSLLSQALKMPDAGELSTRGGGLDLRVSPSMTLSSEVESLEAGGAGSAAWTRYSGGVGLSAWENRLTLRANLSRLVPEDMRLLPSTMANFGVGFDVNDRTRLSLLYQQLFSVAAEEPNRYLAGGISISF